MKKNALPASSPENHRPEEFSLYFHLPFCRRKCDYCHFYVIPESERHKDLLLSSLKCEWQHSLPLIPKEARLASLYFGGGTPSLFAPERIAAIIGWIGDHFPLDDAEITLECNPEESSLPLIAAYKNAGINRISMGVQSLDDGELSLLSRRHSAKAALDAVDAIKSAAIENLSIDLMYDIPGQTTASWEKTVARAATLPITHLSLYNLTIEPHTLYHKYRNKLKELLPAEESSFAMYKEAQERLGAAGLQQYEISAFAKGDNASRHNTGYWLGRPFLGLGPSAYSFWEGVRYKNVSNINRYAASLQKGDSPVDSYDELPVEARRRELFVIALRLLAGVDIPQFEKRWGNLESETLRKIDQLIDSGLLQKSNGRLQLASRGILLYDTIAAELI